MIDIYKYLGMKRKAMLHQWTLANDFGFNYIEPKPAKSSQLETPYTSSNQDILESKNTGNRILLSDFQQKRSRAQLHGHSVPFPFPAQHYLIKAVNRPQASFL